jgi:hypothetical protein
MNDRRDAALSQAVRLREQGETSQAREQLLTPADRYPEDPEITYQTAWVHDVLGLEVAAVPFHERALSGSGLSEEDRRGARESVRTLLRVLAATSSDPAGAALSPGDRALRR